MSNFPLSCRKIDFIDMQKPCSFAMLHLLNDYKATACNFTFGKVKFLVTTPSLSISYKRLLKLARQLEARELPSQCSRIDVFEKFCMDQCIVFTFAKFPLMQALLPIMNEYFCADRHTYLLQTCACVTRCTGGTHIGYNPPIVRSQ